MTKAQPHLRRHDFEVASGSVRTVTFEADTDLPEFLPSWLGDWLQSYIEGGAEVGDGQTLQFGFWLLRCSLEGGRLRLQAPCFESESERWQADLSQPLRSMMVHKYVPESFGVELDVPRMSDTATVGQRFDEIPMFMNRLDPVDNGLDSGWFLGSALDSVDNNDPTQLSVVPLLDALDNAPWVHDYLSLPVGMQVVFESERPVVLQSFEPAQALPGSYFEARFG